MDLAVGGYNENKGHDYDDGDDNVGGRLSPSGLWAPVVRLRRWTG